MLGIVMHWHRRTGSARLGVEKLAVEFPRHRNHCHGQRPPAVYSLEALLAWLMWCLLHVLNQTCALIDLARPELVDEARQSL